MRSINRRQVLAGVAGVTAATVVGSRFALAQDDAQPMLGATPVVSGLNVEFSAGVLPTIYGDIQIPASVERIVTLNDGSLDAVITLGMQAVGATRSSNGESAAEYLLDQVLPEIVYVGGWDELDLELIVSLAPDVILADRYLPPDQYEPLAQIAPTFATGEIPVAQDDAEGLQQWEYELLAWAHVLGKTAEATTAIEEARSRAAGIAANVGDFAGNSVVVFRPQPEFPVVMSHAWMTGRMLTWSGLTGNTLTLEMPPPHSGRDISLEQLDLLNADWLLAATRDQEQTDALEAYKAMPLFQQIDAYASDQVVAVDGALWSGATGIIASHAMMDDIEAIFVNGER
jgi:iron complex transport system substrate-binding protein